MIRRVTRNQYSITADDTYKKLLRVVNRRLGPTEEIISALQGHGYHIDGAIVVLHARIQVLEKQVQDMLVERKMYDPMSLPRP